MRDRARRHDRHPPRCPHWDYRSPGVYFVTVVTARRRRVLSRIVAGRVVLGPIGEIAEACWRAIPEHQPGVELGRFVVMPDHVHGLLLLPRAGQSLSQILALFKAAVTREARRLVPGFPGRLWQRSFYDHIIRDALEWRRIDRYIRTNPERWID